MQAAARGMVGWDHALNAATPTTRFNFAGGRDVSVSGVPTVSDTTLLEVGLGVAVRENVTFGISNGGQHSPDARKHGFNVVLRWTF